MAFVLEVVEFVLQEQLSQLEWEVVQHCLDENNDRYRSMYTVKSSSRDRN